MKKIISILGFTFLAGLQMYAQSSVITVEGGKVKGVPSEAAGVVVYKGIPFAAPPVGDLRWKEPQPVEPWQGVKVCDKFAPRPIQKETPRPAYQNYTTAEFQESSEDCLYLNVWAPEEKPEKPMPVMVWIYGGGFHVGQTDAPVYRGEAFVKKGVIMVSIAYRLGVFGYMSHPLLSKESGHGSGNYAHYDQLAGIEWVKKNIAAFGGDPNNITVFGQSAGSRSLQVLMCSDLSKGLFQRAIPQSGCAIREDAHCLTLAENEKMGMEFMNSLGAKTLDDMRKIDAVTLQQKYENSPYFTKFRPMIDGHLLKRDTNDETLAGHYLDIDYMIGYTKDDVPAAKFQKSIGDWADNQAKLGRRGVYVYRFDRALPGGDMNGQIKDVFGATGAIHSVELGYVFGQIHKANRPMTPADYELSERCVTYWTNFAKYGNPNEPGSSEWKPYTQKEKNVFILDVK